SHSASSDGPTASGAVGWFSANGTGSVVTRCSSANASSSRYNRRLHAACSAARCLAAGHPAASPTASPTTAPATLSPLIRPTALPPARRSRRPASSDLPGSPLPHPHLRTPPRLAEPQRRPTTPPGLPLPHLRTSRGREP